MKMSDREITEFRGMLVGCQIRIAQMALALHKEQERIENLLMITETWLIKDK